MIAITRAEKEAILEKFPNTHIVRTMKNDSKRHHYYCVESPKVMGLLRSIRGISQTGTEHKNKRRR